jgi:hypothetical protein
MFLQIFLNIFREISDLMFCFFSEQVHIIKTTANQSEFDMFFNNLTNFNIALELRTKYWYSYINCEILISV